MKKTWKKVMSLFLVLLMTVSMTGCSACKKGDSKQGKDEAAMPVITGVEDGATYYLGKDTIKPEFDVGKATLKKDGGTPKAFISGTKITELGEYELEVKNGDKKAKVSFLVKEYYPEYPGEMTDMFDNTKLSDAYYISTPNLTVGITDGILTMKNGTGEPWSMMSRRFQHVNASKYPYIEFLVTNVGDGEGTRFELKLSHPDANGEMIDEELVLTARYAGTYYVDLLNYVKAKGLSETDQEICIQFAVVGQNPDYAQISIDYYRSVAEIPEAGEAERYVDRSTETLAAWRSDTATIEAEDDQGTVYVTNSNEKEEYGYIIKRLQLNTEKYPVLVVDIDSVHNAMWSMKCVLNDTGEDIPLTKDINTTGLTKINLLEKGIPRSKNLTITLKFNVIGKGMNKYVKINGFETEAETSETRQEIFREYPGEITDLFDNRRLSDKYELAPNLTATITDGILTMKNGEGEPWSRLDRLFEGVNAAKHPYIEIHVPKVGNGEKTSLEVKLSHPDTRGNLVDEELALTVSYAGTYYIDLLGYVNAKGLNRTSQKINLTLAVVGKSAGYASVSIDYFKSVAAIPAAGAAGRYVDNTSETLGAWRNDTASISISNNQGKVYVTGSNPDEPWGYIIKRLQLNTEDYPYLVVDIDSVTNAQWSLKCIVNDQGEDIPLTEDNASDGRTEINLLEKGIPRGKSVTVTLKFNVIGRGTDKFVTVNGFETNAKSENGSTTGDAPRYVDNTPETLGKWRSNTAKMEVVDGKGKITVINPVETESWGHVLKTIQLNTADYPYLVVDIDSVKDADWSLKCVKNDTNEEITLISDNRATGKTEINLLGKLPESKNLSVTLLLYAVGKGNGQYVMVNGLETNADSLKAPALDIDFSTTDGWVPSPNDLPITLTVENNTGIFTVGGTQPGYGSISYNAVLNTVEQRWLVVDMVSADCDLVLQVNDGKKYEFYKELGKHYVDMQAEDSSFAQGFGVNTKITLLFVGDPGNKDVLNRIYTTSDGPNKDVIDDFSEDNWSHPDAAAGSVVIANNTMTLTKAEANGDFAKTNKFLTLNTSEKHVVKFGISSFQAAWDGGFTIEILNQNGEWVGFKIEGQNLYKVERPGGGYDVYFDLQALAAEKGVPAEKFIGKDLKLFFEIGIGYGAEKSVTLDGIMLVDEQP